MEPREFTKTPMTLYPWTPRPYTNITPFTVRDAATMLEILEKLRHWLRVELVPHVDEEIKKLVDAWEDNILEIITSVEDQLNQQNSTFNDLVTAFTQDVTQQLQDNKDYVDSVIQSVIDNSIEVNDLMVEQMIDQANSSTRLALNKYYAKLSDFQDLQNGVADIVITQGEHETAIGDINAEIDTGRLSADSLNTSFKYYRNVKEYGATGDGATDDTVSIQAALDAGDGTVFFPNGDYLISAELRVPSNVSMLGENRDQSIISMDASAPRHLNTITNSLNERTYRYDYNENIHISNLTLNNNASARVNDGTPWFGNACGIMYAAVHDCSINNVKSINAPLHGFSVDASVLPYENDEDPSFYPPSPSYNVTIRDCVAINPLVDDGFTTHYSYDILIDNCYAEIETPDTTTGGVQNGFEVDDGSYYVTVSNCIAVGFENGFEAKGHENVPSAYNVNFISCIARNCAAGWQLSQGGTPETAHSVNIISCSAENMTDTVNSNIGQKGSSIKNYGYRSVSIRDFTVRNSKFGGILSWTTGGVIIDGVKAINSYTDTPNGVTDGFIRVTGDSTADANHVIRNIEMDTPFSVGSVFRNNSTDINSAVILENVRAKGSGQVAISDSFFSENRTYTGLDVSGFGVQIERRSGSGGALTYVSSPLTISGTGDPEGNVQANPGHIYLRTDGSYGDVLFVKEYGGGTTGWRRVQTEPRG